MSDSMSADDSTTAERRREMREAERAASLRMSEDAVHDQVGHLSACIIGLDENDECRPSARQWIGWLNAIRGPDGLRHLEARELVRCLMADVYTDLRMAALSELCRRHRADLEDWVQLEADKA